MLNALVAREELCRQLSLRADSDDIVPEQQIAGMVSRYFSALSERSETDAWHRVVELLVRELTESDLLSFHTGNIAESRRLNIPRTAYYWYGGFVAKRVAMMLGCYDIYLWNEMIRSGTICRCRVSCLRSWPGTSTRLVTQPYELNLSCILSASCVIPLIPRQLPRICRVNEEKGTQ